MLLQVVEMRLLVYVHLNNMGFIYWSKIMNMLLDQKDSVVPAFFIMYVVLKQASVSHSNPPTQ